MLSPALTTRLLTPQMAGLLDRIQRAGRPALHTMTPPQARLAYERAAEVHADTPSHRLFGNGFMLDAATIDWMFDHTIDLHDKMGRALKEARAALNAAAAALQQAWPA